MPLVTVIVTMFSPSDHVAAAPFATDTPPTLILTVAFASTGVAVMVLVAFVVSAVYSVIPLSKAGVRLSEPIVSPDRPAFKGLS